MGNNILIDLLVDLIQQFLVTFNSTTHPWPRVAGRSAGNGSSCDYARSKIPAIPCPPPMHIVTSAWRLPVRASS
jgi:hypothetical protein